MALRRVLRLLVLAASGSAVVACAAPPAAPQHKAHASPTQAATHHHTPKSRPSLVAGAVWLHPAEGYRLQVHPSRYGRRNAAANPPRALRQALHSAAPTPFHLTRNIRDSLTNQLRCHAEFAGFKPRWDLEAWRPDVGYVRTVAAFCNP